MNRNSTGNVRASDATWKTQAKTEKELIRYRMARAEAALARIASDTGNAVKRAFDVVEVTKNHPITSTLTAAAAGFLAGEFMRPASKETVQPNQARQRPAFRKIIEDMLGAFLVGQLRSAIKSSAGSTPDPKDAVAS